VVQLLASLSSRPLEYFFASVPDASELYLEGIALAEGKSPSDSAAGAR